MDALKLDCVDAETIHRSHGGRPLCASVDEIVLDACGRWAVCRRHQTRWCIGDHPKTNGGALFSEAWQSIRGDLIVEPLRSAEDDTERNR